VLEGIDPHTRGTDRLESSRCDTRQTVPCSSRNTGPRAAPVERTHRARPVRIWVEKTGFTCCVDDKATRLLRDDDQIVRVYVHAYSVIGGLDQIIEAGEAILSRDADALLAKLLDE